MFRTTEKKVSRHLYFKNAFFHVALDRPLFAKMPKYTYNESEQEEKAFRIKSSMYGLKHAAHIWNELLFNVLKKMGLKEVEPAPCIFIQEHMYMICHVEDLVVFAKQEKQILYLMIWVKQHFKLKDLGSPKQFLGIELKWSERGTLQMRQTSVIDKHLKETGTEQANATGSPMKPLFSCNESLDADQFGAEEHRK